MKFRSLKENSTASHIRYITSEVSCLYHDAGSDKKFRIRFRCPINRGCFFSTISGPLVGNAKCNFESLDGFLNVDLSGKYVLRPERSLSESIQNGSIIAVGLNSREFPYLASIRMSGALLDVGPTFVAIPVSSENDITLEPVCDAEWNAEDVKVEQLLKMHKKGFV